MLEDGLTGFTANLDYSSQRESSERLAEAIFNQRFFSDIRNKLIQYGKSVRDYIISISLSL